jgi:hypothetical protein
MRFLGGNAGKKNTFDGKLFRFMELRAADQAFSAGL